MNRTKRGTGVRVTCWLGLAAITVFSANRPLQAETDALSYLQLRQSGLEVVWQSQVQINPGQEYVADSCLHVHNSESNTFYELSYAGILEKFSYNDLNPRGELFGKEGAEEWKNIRLEMLEAEGFDVAVQLHTIARTTMVSLTSSGLVQALDAESGQTLWTRQVGPQNLYSHAVAMNDTFVVVVREGKVYCINLDDGTIAWERPLAFVAGGGLAVSDSHAYVTLHSGSIEMFALEDELHAKRILFSNGVTTSSDPILTPRTVSWSTSRGDLNVAHLDNGNRLVYRLATGFSTKTGSELVGDYLVICSYDGEVHCVLEQEGKVAWKFHTGANITRRPIGVGEHLVLVITERNELIALDASTGQIMDGWPTSIPQITEYVGASRNLLYFLDINRNLIGINRESGTPIVRTPVGDRKPKISNVQTDRFYLGTDDGQLVCLREVSSTNPLFHSDDATVDPFDTSDPFADPVDSETSPPTTADPFSPTPVTPPPTNEADPFKVITADEKKDDADTAENIKPPTTSDPTDPFDIKDDKKDNR